MTSRGKSTPSLGVGLLITPRSTRARWPHSAIASISIWCDGRKGSTNAWNERLDEHEHGCEGSEKGNPSCSCIGGTVRYPDKTERHEPYESRGSRADLWGPEAAMPPAPTDPHVSLSTHTARVVQFYRGSAQCLQCTNSSGSLSRTPRNHARARRGARSRRLYFLCDHRTRWRSMRWQSGATALG